MPGFSDLFEDLLTVLRQPSQEDAFEENPVALDMMVQVRASLNVSKLYQAFTPHILAGCLNAVLAFIIAHVL
jgi:hypothetical protein